MTRAKIDKAERRLQDQLRALDRALKRPHAVMVERSPERADEAQAEHIESCGIDLENMTWQLQRQVLAALNRIERGEYGACEWCGEPLSPKRLQALPWAALCVNCQAREEAEDLEQAA